MENIRTILITLLLLCISGIYSDTCPYKSNTKPSEQNSYATVCNPKNFDCNAYEKNLVYYRKKLQPFYDQVMAHKPLSSKDGQLATEIVIEYYTFLIDHDIVYAKLALDVVINHGLFGRVANIHLYHRVKVEGYGDQVKSIEMNLRVSLAYSDAKLRSECKEFIPYRAIADYHYDMFAHQGLSKYAWGGTLLEEFSGTGSWMAVAGYDKNVKFSPVNMIKAIVLNKQAKNGVKAREAFDSVQHLFLEDFGDSLVALFCGTWSVLCES